MTKKYFLFAGYNYYPSGGWRDYKGTYDTEVECYKFLLSSNDNYDWYHIVDTETMTYVDTNE